MMYFDVTYRTPNGIEGVHYAVEAVNQYEAARYTPIALCYATRYTPDMFTIVKVVRSKNIPIERQTPSLIKRMLSFRFLS